MTYKAYPNTATTPSRLTRKQARRNVFQVNRKMKKLQRKAEREARS